MFVSPGEILITFNNVSIYFYGVILATAILVAILFTDFVQRKYYPQMPKEIVYDISPFLIIAGILGARIYYCCVNSSYFLNHPNEIIMIAHGGISIHGAILGGLIALIIFAKIKKLSVLKLCDMFSYGMILAQAIGRWGNFFNSEAFGMPANHFLKLYIPIEKRPPQFIDYEYFHPTFLYESVLNLIVFCLLFFVLRKRFENKSGLIFCSYLILYSLVRLFVESIRVDSVLNVFTIPIAQFVSILIIIIAIIMFGFLARKNNCR